MRRRALEGLEGLDKRVGGTAFKAGETRFRGERTERERSRRIEPNRPKLSKRPGLANRLNRPNRIESIGVAAPPDDKTTFLYYNDARAFFQRELPNETIFRDFFRPSGGAVPIIDTMRKARRPSGLKSRGISGINVWGKLASLEGLRSLEEGGTTSPARLNAAPTALVEKGDDGESG